MEMVVRSEAITIFPDEELQNFVGVKASEPGYVEIECGCTGKCGDTVGVLRVYSDGKLEIVYQCFPQGPQEIISPAEFAKNGGKTMTVTNWKNHIWVTNTKGRKVKLWKTCLLRYYKETFHRPLRGPTIHRDEFIRCSICSKERRFCLRTKEKCRIYHDALANENWRCSDMPYENQMTCDDAEERKGRKPCRGCPASPTCKGCIRCVCFGCNMCRFEDCNCRTCVDFIQNATP